MVLGTRLLLLLIAVFSSNPTAVNTTTATSITTETIKCLSGTKQQPRVEEGCQRCMVLNDEYFCMTEPVCQLDFGDGLVVTSDRVPRSQVKVRGILQDIVECCGGCDFCGQQQEGCPGSALTEITKTVKCLAGKKQQIAKDCQRCVVNNGDFGCFRKSHCMYRVDEYTSVYSRSIPRSALTANGVLQATFECCSVCDFCGQKAEGCLASATLKPAITTKLIITKPSVTKPTVTKPTSNKPTTTTKLTILQPSKTIKCLVGTKQQSSIQENCQRCMVAGDEYSCFTRPRCLFAKGAFRLNRSVISRSGLEVDGQAVPLRCCGGCHFCGQRAEGCEEAATPGPLTGAGAQGTAGLVLGLVLPALPLLRPA